MAKLGEKHRRGDLSERVSETEEDTTTREDSVVRSTSLKTGTNSHDDETETDRRATTPAIRDEGNERDRSDGSNLVESDEETESATAGAVEEVLPAVEVLNIVHVHAIPTSSHRRSAENACVETQLPQTRLLVPSNMLKLGSFITKPLGLLVGAKANDLLDTHNDDLLNQSSKE
jgi:hypothetical protein